MAETAHLQILMQGVDRWNKWRKDYPDIQPELSNADLSNLDLSHGSFQNANLSGAQLQNVNLSQAHFEQADLSYSKFNGATSSASSFHQANLYHAELRNSAFVLGTFTYANLQGTLLSKATFSGTDLSDANLNDANLVGSIIRECNLQRTLLQNAHLFNAQFRGTILTQADLSGANLVGTDFTYARLNETSCHHATMGWTQLGALDLNQFQGLETVTHIAPSEISLSTLYRCQENPPETFLLNAGVPQSWLDLCKQQSIQFLPTPKCFLCYCTSDRVFAEKLQIDLQRLGVHCWLSFFPEFGEEYTWKDQSFFDFLGAKNNSFLPLFDQMIFLLSAQSTNQLNTMGGFMNMALQREKQLQHPVLFPLQLDAAVAGTKFVREFLPQTHPLRDFSQLQDESMYQKNILVLAHDLHQYKL